MIVQAAKACSRSRRWSDRDEAFTLIELLVVVSLIVLLIALLMPVLGQARETANVTVCASTIRQIGSAAISYTRDYDNRWCSAFEWTRHTSTWPDEWHIRERVTEGLLFPYIQNEDLYLCPTFRKVYTFGDKPYWCGHTGVTAYFSYTMNASLGWPGWAGLQLQTVNGVKAPSKFLMYSEENTWTIAGLSNTPINNGAIGINSDCIASYHLPENGNLLLGRGNVLFVDSHVELRYPSDSAVLLTQ